MTIYIERHKTKDHEVMNSNNERRQGSRISQAQWNTLITPVFRCLRQEDHKFKAYLGNIVSSRPAYTKSIAHSLKKKKVKINKTNKQASKTNGDNAGSSIWIRYLNDI